MSLDYNNLESVKLYLNNGVTCPKLAEIIFKLKKHNRKEIAGYKIFYIQYTFNGDVISDSNCFLQYSIFEPSDTVETIARFISRCFVSSDQKLKVDIIKFEVEVENRQSQEFKIR